MFIAEFAILLILYPLRMLPLVLGRRVVAMLANRAFQRYNFAHFTVPPVLSTFYA